MPEAASYSIPIFINLTETSGIQPTATSPRVFSYTELSKHTEENVLPTHILFCFNARRPFPNLITVRYNRKGKTQKPFFPQLMKLGENKRAASSQTRIPIPLLLQPQQRWEALLTQTNPNCNCLNADTLPTAAYTALPRASCK